LFSVLEHLGAATVPAYGMKRFFSTFILAAAALAAVNASAPPAQAADAPAPSAPHATAQAAPRWTVEKAAQWQRDTGWLCGVNYIPADAINYTAMWDKTSFNPALIDRELALAASIGFNCVRVVLQHAVYAGDPGYFLKTLDTFLAICARHKIRAMPCFFDDCVFGVNTEPRIGKQPEPRIGWYAWAWSPSPGHRLVRDRSAHPLLEKYVKAVLEKFRDDPRVCLWDLYNEPTNGIGNASLALVRGVFRWAREVNPSQPVTIGVWNGNRALNDYVLKHSDIMTFHSYGQSGAVENHIRNLRRQGRPIVCTEWMNRGAKSTVATILPLLKERGAGAISWGLVNGKTQTNLPWGHRPERLPYKGPWQHDLFHGNHKPYDPQEIALIKKMTGKE
jgi:hypothetical protein